MAGTLIPVSDIELKADLLFEVRYGQLYPEGDFRWSQISGAR